MNLPKFYELNAKLNREVLDFERRALDGTHTPMGDVSTHEAFVGSGGARAHILGGSGPVPASGTDESIEERRHKTLEAALSRQKEETEDGYGTGQPRPSQED